MLPYSSMRCKSATLFVVKSCERLGLRLHTTETELTSYVNATIHNVDVIRLTKNMQSMHDEDSFPICQGTFEETVLENGLANVGVHCGQGIIE